MHNICVRIRQDSQLLGDLLAKVLLAGKMVAKVPVFDDVVDEEAQEESALLGLEEQLAEQVRRQLMSKSKKAMGKRGLKLARVSTRKRRAEAQRPAADPAEAAGQPETSVEQPPPRPRRGAVGNAHLFWWGPFEFKRLSARGVETGVSAECLLHTTAGDCNECSRGLTFGQAGGGLTKGQCITHVKRWLCIGCSLNEDDKLIHMGRALMPRKLSTPLDATQRARAIAISASWSAAERAEINSL